MKNLIINNKNIIIPVVLSLLFFILGFFLSIRLSTNSLSDSKEIVFENIIRPNSVPANLSTLWEAYSFVNDVYFDQTKIDDSKITNETIKALVKTLDDKHSTYIPPEEWAIKSTDLFGSFQGIGAFVDMSKDNSGVMIVAPIDGGPAQLAGIKGGDKIIKVDGESIAGMSLTAAIKLIRGPEGSTVSLTIERLGEINLVELDIIRAKIKQPSVTKDLIKDTDYTKIRINQYTENTPKELSEMISDTIMNDGSKGLVIDLRNNPGGLLASAVNSTSLFLDEGVVTFELDSKGKKTLWNTNGEVGKFSNIPIVTLVNANSASGSEVMAGALQDYGRSVIIGETTYGKGSVSLVRDLSNGGGMLLTNAHWFTPNGRVIHDIGITPDVEIELPETTSKSGEFYDTQVEAAIKQLDFELTN